MSYLFLSCTENNKVEKMKTENYIKWLLFAFLSLFLVACKPTAKFNYSPTAPTAGEVVKFDASTSSVYKAKLCTRQISQNPYPIRVLPS